MKQPNRVPNKTCVRCGKGFYAAPSQQNKSKHCSRACLSLTIKDMRPEGNRRCRHCHKKFRTNPAYIARRKSAGIYCSNKCFYAHKAIPRKGKRDSLGYITMRGTKNIRQHRWVMEQHLGRKLSTNEHVHHINGKKTDNRIENLEVMTASKHHRLHGGRLIRTGKTFQCDVCGACKYYPPSVYSELGKTYRCIGCRILHGFAPGVGPSTR